MTESDERQQTLGAALRRAWVGYQRRMDREMAAAGFGDRGFPDGRVLRSCSRSDDVTISKIGRELGITRQGASKVVAGLRERKYVTVNPSATSGREKVVQLTPLALQYLEAQRTAARTIERELQLELGDGWVDSLRLLLDALGGGDQPSLRDYLRQTSHLGRIDGTED